MTDGQAAAGAGRPVRWVASALLAAHAWLLAYGAVVHSPTYNEPAHLVAGVGCWRFGRFDLYTVNPPLARLAAAAPVTLVGYETDWRSFRDGPGARPEMALASDFCEANGARVVWLVTLARWACVPFSLLGGYICFRWARALYGDAAGVLALTLWCVCPNVLAFGQLVTCDSAATALGAAACYAFWRWLRAPTWQNAALSGLALGLAELTKTTLLILYPLWPLLWLAYRRPDRATTARSSWRREAAMLAACAALSLYVMNLGYGFEGAFTRLGDYRFVSRSFSGDADAGSSGRGGNRFSGSWLGEVPVPLPASYLAGIDLQRKDFESYGHEFYLGGTWSRTGWWYYYLYALAVKVPLGTWTLLPLALAVRLTTGAPARARDELVLLAPGAVILVLVSSQTGLNEHMRYVLPVFPFAFVWLGGVAAGLAPRERSVRLTAARAAVAAAVAWSSASSLSCYPHSLSYFNEAVGGPKNGWRHLSGSNVDWGQDLLYLKRWADAHPRARPLRLALFGTINPSLVGLDGEIFTPDAEGPGLAPGYYAVSATVLSGFGVTPHDRLAKELEKVREYETVGGSIVVFRKE